MMFNIKKFEAPMYGQRSAEATTSYISPEGSIIPDKNNLRDLGYTMSADGNFRKYV